MGTARGLWCARLGRAAPRRWRIRVCWPLQSILARRISWFLKGGLCLCSSGVAGACTTGMRDWMDPWRTRRGGCSSGFSRLDVDQGPSCWGRPVKPVPLGPFRLLSGRCPEHRVSLVPPDLLRLLPVLRFAPAVLLGCIRLAWEEAHVLGAARGRSNQWKEPRRVCRVRWEHSRRLQGMSSASRVQLGRSRLYQAQPSARGAADRSLAARGIRHASHAGERLWTPLVVHQLDCQPLPALSGSAWQGERATSVPRSGVLMAFRAGFCAPRPFVWRQAPAASILCV